MSNNGEDTIYTGPAKWFTSASINGPGGWRLDVVTLLAVIGESSIADHAQTITASMLCLFPRIIPAPQALLKGTRPTRLPETHAKITGVYSGVTLETVGFFANILHPLDDLKALSFKKLYISHADQNCMQTGQTLQATSKGNGKKASDSSTKNKKASTSPSTLGPSRIPTPPKDTELSERGSSHRANSPAFGSDVEAQKESHQLGIKRRATDFITNPTMGHRPERPAIPAALWSPIHILSVLSIALTFAIIGTAAHWQDGTAMLSVFLISIASSVVGLASWWGPRLMNRSARNQVPDGDVVIRTREGAFLLIKCTEEVARELYSGTEECEYRIGPKLYRILMGIGTLLLMISVILLGNCGWDSQLFIGASYIILNGAYWAMGLLPDRLFWDLSRYKVVEKTPGDAMKAEETTDLSDPDEGEKSFTRTLWYVIRETKRTAWVSRSGAAPATSQWKLWLAEAEEAAKDQKRDWHAVARKNVIMKMSEFEAENHLEKMRKRSTGSEIEWDPAGQVAPVTAVQGRDAPNPNVGSL